MSDRDAMETVARDYLLALRSAPDLCTGAMRTFAGIASAWDPGQPHEHVLDALELVPANGEGRIRFALECRYRATRTPVNGELVLVAEGLGYRIADVEEERDGSVLARTILLSFDGAPREIEVRGYVSGTRRGGVLTLRVDNGTSEVMRVYLRVGRRRLRRRIVVEPGGTWGTRMCIPNLSWFRSVTVSAGTWTARAEIPAAAHQHMPSRLRTLLFPRVLVPLLGQAACLAGFVAAAAGQGLLAVALIVVGLPLLLSRCIGLLRRRRATTHT